MTSGSSTISPGAHPRVERRVGVLEDHLHVAPRRPHLAGRIGEHVVAPIAHFARGRLDQAQHAAAGRALAAAGFADQAERLALVDREADAVDRLHDGAAAEQAAAAREMLGEVAHLDERLAHRVAPPTVDAGAYSTHRARWPSATTTSGGTARSHSSSRVAAARRERAARRQRCQARHDAVDRYQAATGVAARNRGQQPARVGMRRCRGRSRAPAPLRRCARHTSRRRDRPLRRSRPRSCVMSSSDRSKVRFISRSRSRICACTVTSSAVVGSSAITSGGLQASATASMTRWRMPPDSWCG